MKKIFFLFHLLIMASYCYSQTGNFSRDSKTIDSITHNLSTYNIKIIGKDTIHPYPENIPNYLALTFPTLRRKKISEHLPAFTIYIVIDDVQADPVAVSLVRTKPKTLYVNAVGEPLAANVYAWREHYYLTVHLEVRTNNISYSVPIAVNQEFINNVESTMYEDGPYQHTSSSNELTQQLLSGSYISYHDLEILLNNYKQGKHKKVIIRSAYN